MIAYIKRQVLPQLYYRTFEIRLEFFFQRNGDCQHTLRLLQSRAFCGFLPLCLDVCGWLWELRWLFVVIVDWREDGRQAVQQRSLLARWPDEAAELTRVDLTKRQPVGACPVCSSVEGKGDAADRRYGTRTEKKKGNSSVAWRWVRIWWWGWGWDLLDNGD